MYMSLVFGDEILAQGLHLKSHQRSSARIRKINCLEKWIDLYFKSCVCVYRTPEQCPSVVSLLSESYNPHVRCGAAMALGICCAGTGSKVSFEEYCICTQRSKLFN